MINFDPTVDYSERNLADDTGKTLYLFGELIKTLVILTCDGERQREIIGFGAAADEMAEDFHTFFTLSYNRYTELGLLNIDQVDELKKIDIFLDDQSGDKSPGFWDDLKLDTDPGWTWVRIKAREILKLMNMENLLLEFIREEQYRQSISGKKLSVQWTKTWLIRK